MTVLIGQQSQDVTGAYFQRKIRCPGHYLVPPTEDVYLYRPVELLKNCSDFVEYQGKPIRIKKSRVVTDAWGRKMINWKKLYDLRRRGIVIQPWVTASFAIENIFDPTNPVCILCDKRCKRGKGVINELGIKRLHG